jgi:hypothetical protein
MKQRTRRNKEKYVRKGRIRRKEYVKPGENKRNRKKLWSTLQAYVTVCLV